MSVSAGEAANPSTRAPGSVEPSTGDAAAAASIDPTGPAAWTARQRRGMGVQAAVALLLIGVALQSSIRGLDDHNLRVHHLEHAALLAGGGLLGLLAALRVRPPGRNFSWGQRSWLRSAALGLLVFEPLALMAVMIPSTSPWIEARPPVHALEHLILIGLGAALGLVGRLFSPALGWLLVALTAGMMAVFGGMILAQPVVTAIGHAASVLLTLLLNVRA
ncbi:MAG: hypothetical protein ACRDGS_07800 [Chloroflexota bacterium]